MRRVSSVVSLGLGALALGTFASASSAQGAELTPTEKVNKQVVLDFYAALNRGDAEGNQKQTIQATAEKYLSPNYTQHSANMKNLPGAGTDRDKLIRMFQSMPARTNAPPMAPQKVEAIMAEGDLVMFLTSRTPPGPGAEPSYVFNMFRVKDGKLVDHWDVSPGAGGPPPTAGAPLGSGGPPPGAPR